MNRHRKQIYDYQRGMDVGDKLQNTTMNIHKINNQDLLYSKGTVFNIL